MNSSKHPGFASRWGFILASVGSAVGMANVWGFPNKMGTNGGGAFLLRNGVFDGFHNVACLALRSLADFICLSLRLLDSFHDFQRQSIHPLSG